MRMIKISEEVWEAIAERGKFGETEDDVLRREFGLPDRDAINTGTPAIKPPTHTRKIRATQRMSSYIVQNQLHLEFQNGASSSWSLPNPNDKVGIRDVLEKALEFARQQKASVGQLNAVRKTLTSEGYHLTK